MEDYDYMLPDGRQVLLREVGPDLLKLLKVHPYDSETMWAVAKHIVKGRRDEQDTHDLVAVCRQCIAEFDRTVGVPTLPQDRRAMGEICLILARAYMDLARVPVSAFSRWECEELMLPLRRALEYRPHSRVCLYELGRCLNCLSRAEWNKAKAASLVQERDAAMEKSAKLGYIPAIVERTVRRLYSQDKSEETKAEEILMGLVEKGVYEAGYIMAVWHRTHGRCKKSQEVIQSCIDHGCPRLAQERELISVLPKSIPPDTTPDSLFGFLTG